MRRCLYRSAPIWILILFGCVPDEPQRARAEPISIVVATPEELVDEWMELASDPVASASNPRSFELVYRLSTVGDGALMPILEVIGDEASDAHTKVFAVRCLAGRLDSSYLPRLRDLAGKEGEATTRACAIMLMGHVDDAAVTEDLRTALGDSERRIRFAAMLGLARHGDAESRTELIDKYFEAETSSQESTEIVRAVLDRLDAEAAALLSHALLSPEMGLAMRTQIAAALGRIGDNDTIEVLRRSLNIESGPPYDEIVYAAVAAIEERESEGL